MSNIDEVKKLKKLLDDGIITEADFKKQKKKLLELEEQEKEEKITESKTSNKKSLDDYESELIKEAAESLSEEETKNEKKRTAKSIEEDIYLAEKTKEKARLDAEREHKKEKSAENKQTINKYYGKVKRIFKWILAVFCWIITLGCLTDLPKQLVYNLGGGIIFLILGMMLCPKISDRTSKYTTYTKFKWLIGIILFIVFVILSNSVPE